MADNPRRGTAEGLPMSSEDSFEDVMARLRGGDDSAADEIFHRFAGRLIGLARQKLDVRLRAKVDAEDVLQSVYRTFFRRHAEGEFVFDGWSGLWSLLTIITVRKCGRWRQHYKAAQRDVALEVPLGDRPDAPPPEAVASLAREPSPVEALVLAEVVEALLRGLPERDQAIVSLRLQGHAPADIAEQLGRPERTVFRVLDRVKRRLRRLRDEDEQPS
jgi:RNA polymerase sigma-70 factor (ECF subfamily)